MVVVLRLVFGCAAGFAFVAGPLVFANFFVPGRAPQTAQFIVITLAVGAVFLGVGWLLFGIQRRALRTAAMVSGRPGQASIELAAQVHRLLALLLTGGILVVVVLGAVAYAILARIDQGFAVFG